MGSLKCTIFGHNYTDTETHTDKRRENGQTVVIEKEQSQCKRCGESRSRDVRKRVIDSEEEQATNNTQQTDGSNSQLTNASSNKNTESVNFRSQQDHMKRDIDSEDDTGVILENDNGSNTENRSNKNLRDKADKKQDGAVVVDTKQTKQVLKKVECESCDFGKEETETARRDGDLCPQCGAWLSVRDVRK